MILVRKGELACRDSWGGDYWTDAKHLAGGEAAAPVAGHAASTAMETPMREQAPDVAASAETVTRSRQSEDMTVNPAAHLEQEERAAAIRLGTRDAIRLARERSADRKSGRHRAAEPSAAPGSSDASSAPAEDQIIVRPTASSPVPASEVAAHGGNAADEKYNTVPDIRPDVELPRLRQQFRLPGQHAAGVSSTTSPTSQSHHQNGTSTYDRVLQRAMAYRAANGDAARDNDDLPPPSDTAISRPMPNVEPPQAENAEGAEASADDFTPPDNDHELEDEVVAFHVDRTTRFSRFTQNTLGPSNPVEDADELDNEVQDDYELDRAYRPEPPVTRSQSGLRWWQQARNRVFGFSHQAASPAFSLDETVAGSDGAAPDDLVERRPISRSAQPASCAIEWDNQTLAPLPQPRNDQMTDQVTLDGPIWSSLEYLVETDCDEEPAGHADPTPGEPPDDYVFGWDLHQPSGMDSLRERLFGQTLQPAYATATRVAERPTALASEPRGPFEDELPSRDWDFRAEAAFDNAGIDPAPEFEPVAYPYDSGFNPDFDLRRLVITADEPPIDLRIAIAPDIPRKCATCRNFRAADGGDRGWCTNRWAFPHQPLVNAEDLACESSMGAWWLPDLDAWDQEAFLSRLTQRTPRTDLLQAMLRGLRHEGRRTV